MSPSRWLELVLAHEERGTDSEARLINTAETEAEGGRRDERGDVRRGVREGERGASLQIATPHCGVTPGLLRHGPGISPEWCPRARGVVLSFVVSLLLRGVRHV